MLGAAPTAGAVPSKVLTYTASCNAYTAKPANTIRLTVTVDRDKINGKYGYFLRDPRATSTPNGWVAKKAFVNGGSTEYTTGSTVTLSAVMVRGSRVEGISCTVYLIAVP